MRNKKRTWAVWAAALSVGALCAYGLRERQRRRSDVDASGKSPPVVEISAPSTDRHHPEPYVHEPPNISVLPAVPKRAGVPEDPSEKRAKLERSRAFVVMALDWLAQRRAAAERASRPEEVAALTIRIERLAPRLRSLQQGRDPDEALIPAAAARAVHD